MRNFITKKRNTSKVNYRIPCSGCGKTMEANRSTKKTCDACKQKAKEAKKKKTALPKTESQTPVIPIDTDRLALDIFFHNRPHKEIGNGWSFAYTKAHIVSEFGYSGPFPKRKEFMVYKDYAMFCINDYDINELDSTSKYSIKPLEAMRPDEQQFMVVHAVFMNKFKQVNPRL